MRAKIFECKVVWIFIFYAIKDEISFLFFNFLLSKFFTVRIAYLYIFRCCSGVACSYVRACQEGVLTWAMDGSEGALYTECDDCKN